MDRQIHIPEAVQGAIAKGLWHLDIFEAKQLRSGRDIVAEKPFDTRDMHNLLTNTGGQLLIDLLMGAGGTAMNNANTNIGVGNGTTAVNASHTDLQGASKLRKAMQATYPSRSGQIMTMVSIFATGDANWSWEEIAAFNAAAAGTMFNRALVTAPFTKTSALSITATLTWTLS